MSIRRFRWLSWWALVLLAGCAFDFGSDSPVKPSIKTQPARVTAAQGASASFSIVAEGSAPLTYRWHRNGIAIAGADASSYTIPAVDAADSGVELTVAVRNAAGSITSAGATLLVTAPIAPSIAVQPAAPNLVVPASAAIAAPAIVTQPLGATVVSGQGATFSVSANGTGPLAFQWRKDGAPVAGTTGSSYTTPPATSADNGALFSVVVSNETAAVASEDGVLTVYMPARLARP